VALWGKRQSAEMWKRMLFRNTIWHGDNLDVLRELQPESVDLVYLDPPFKSDLIARCAELVEANGWIKRGGLVYVEAPSQVDVLPLPATWELIRSKKAGQVGYHLAQKTG